MGKRLGTGGGPCCDDFEAVEEPFLREAYVRLSLNLAQMISDQSRHTSQIAWESPPPARWALIMPIPVGTEVPAECLAHSFHALKIEAEHKND